MFSAWRAARGLRRSQRRGRDKNQCDFKTIEVNLSLNNCNLQLLYLPPPLPRTSEMPSLIQPMIHFAHHSAFERSIKGSLWRDTLTLSVVFHQKYPSIIPLGRPKSYKDSSETFCQYHLVDAELRKFLTCYKKCFL